MRLRVPGPTPLPARTRAAMSEQVSYHRDLKFSETFEEIVQRIRPLFGTRCEPFVLTSSGTGALEAAIINTISPGDKALVLDNGHWSQRLAGQVQAVGGLVDFLSVEWGQPSSSSGLAEKLENDGPYSAVLVVHNDTFTGVVTNIAEIGTIVSKTESILIVDAVSSIGSLPFEMDAWHADIVVTGSQKGLMSPPGLGLLSISDKAFETISRKELRGTYFDLLKHRQASKKYQTAFTAPVNLFVGLRESLRLIHEHGIENNFLRQATLNEALVRGLEALDLKLFPSKKHASTSVAVLEVPPNVSASQVVKTMKSDFNTVISGARNSRLEGRVIRLGTMGAITKNDVLLDVTYVARALAAQQKSVNLRIALDEVFSVFDRHQPADLILD